jgi:PAS domain S-box-containing protein
METDTIKLGLMPPLTGLVGIYGPEIARAGHIACQDVNENGGVLGRPLELIIEDDGSMPESAIIAAERLADRDGCSTIIGNLLSNSRIAVAYRVAEPRKLPYLNFSFYEGSIVSRYFFHFAALPNQQIDRMIPYMREKFGPRMFFAGNNYEWPRGSIHAGKAALRSVGGQVVGEEYCPIGVDPQDIESLLDQVEAAGPDVFVPYFAGSDQLALLTRFTERGLKTRMAVVMGHYDEMMASNLSPEIRAGFYSSNTYFMTVDTPGNRNFLSSLREYPDVTGVWPHGNGILTNFGEGAYVCVKAFAEAANLAGTLDPEALVDALASIVLEVPQGTVRTNPQHHHARVNTYLSRCGADGIFTIVEKFGAIDPLLPERYSHEVIEQSTTLEDDFRLQARILELMSEAVFLARVEDDAIVYANAGAERMFGYDSGKMLGMTIRQIFAIPADEAEDIFHNAVSVLVRKGDWQGEVYRNGKDNSEGSCSLSASAFTHPVYGEVWLFVASDITERKAAEDRIRGLNEELEQRVMNRTVELKQSEDRLRIIMDNAVDGIVVINHKGIVESFSRSAARMFGYNATEVIGKNVRMLMPQPYRGRHDDYLHRYVAGGEARIIGIEREVKGRRRDGSTFPLEIAVSEVEMEGVQLFTGLVRDITARKRVQEELISAWKAADAANKAKSVFLSSMSHELRTPLNAILGFAQLQRDYSDQPLSDEQRQSIEQILEGGQHLLALINEVLDLSKIEAGEVELSLGPFDAAEIIQESVALVRPIADQLGVSFIVGWTTPPTLQAMADKSRLKQVLLNLLSNAVKYNHDKGTMTVAAAETSSGTARISISDTGSGIPADRRDEVFRPFSRLGLEASKIEGTGIGLTISRRLVENMGGGLDFDSTVGEGSTFWCELPIAEPQRPSTGDA